MKQVLFIIMVIGVVSIIGILCFFSLFLSEHKDEILKSIKFKGEKK